jgi:predicted ATPase
MKFNQIEIQQEITSTKGITEIKLGRLSNVIVFVGKNGSGKTRILDLLEQNLFESVNFIRLLNKSVGDMPKQLQIYINELQPYQQYFQNQDSIKLLKSQFQKDPSNVHLSRQIPQLQTKNNSLHHQAAVNLNGFNDIVTKSQIIIDGLKDRYFRRIKYEEIQQLQDALDDSPKDTITFENLVEMVTENVYDEFKLIHKSGLKFLSRLPHQLAFDQYECLVNNKVLDDRISFKRYLSLKKFVQSFLKKDLTWEQKMSKGKLTEVGNDVTFKGVWKLDEREFNYNEFSSGEKSLFAYALLLFLIEQNQNLNIKESVILVDEPELHLHPESEIDLITGLRDAIGEHGQLIFATHSINILSHLNYEEIFMVSKGKISHPSQATIGQSLSQLMGIEDRIKKLSEFLSSISTWTFVNFMAECFSNPEVIESSNANDPQVLAFKKAVSENGSNSKNMLLDFGAGKGRLFEQLKADFDFITKVNYSALEPDTNLHENLKALGAKEIFANHNTLPESKFDFVLLCNVLHEIPIKEWVPTINKISKSVSDNGFLVVIEAKTLTKGEKIGTEGYILLDVEEFKVLFKLEELPTEITIKGKEDIITCVVISKKQLRQISTTDVIDTLKTLEKNTFKKIQNVRQNLEVNSVGLGRKNAFLSQLYINSKIAQLSLSSKK